MSTRIEWVKNRDGTQGRSWNPVTGCTKISPGCKNCYAERMARRLAGRCGYPEVPHHFDVTLRPDRLEQPLKRKKPTTYFVCSMSDLFHEDVPFLFIGSVFATIIAADWHTFQILTKRVERMQQFVAWFQEQTSLSLRSFRHIWLSVSIENQDYLWRAEELLKCPAAMRFVSLEPLLGPILFRRRWLNPYPERFADGFNVHTGKRRYRDVERPRLNWVIVGGESGPGARPMHPDWVRSIRNQCVAADTDFFFKQWGAWVCPTVGGYKDMPFPSIKGDGWHGETGTIRIGKKAAGRLLDGRTWNEMPKRVTHG